MTSARVPGSGSAKGTDAQHLHREKQRMMKENKMFLIVEKNFHKVARLSKDLEKHIEMNTVSWVAGRTRHVSYVCGSVWS